MAVTSYHSILAEPSGKMERCVDMQSRENNWFGAWIYLLLDFTTQTPLTFEYPGLQSHLYDPIVLIQIVFSPGHTLSASHSSSSVEEQKQIFT